MFPDEVPHREESSSADGSLATVTTPMLVEREQPPEQPPPPAKMTVTMHENPLYRPPPQTQAVLKKSPVLGGGHEHSPNPTSPRLGAVYRPQQQQVCSEFEQWQNMAKLLAKNDDILWFQSKIDDNPNLFTFVTLLPHSLSIIRCISFTSSWISLTFPFSSVLRLLCRPPPRPSALPNNWPSSTSTPARPPRCGTTPIPSCGISTSSPCDN